MTRIAELDDLDRYADQNVDQVHFLWMAERFDRVVTETLLAERRAEKAVKADAIWRERRKRHAILASADWLQLRYARFLIDNGFCQCRWCRAAWDNKPIERPFGVLMEEAFAPIPVHYTASGSAPWRRIRGFSTHHVRYDLVNPKLSDLRTTYPHHHAAEEALYSTRRRYLAGTK